MLELDRKMQIKNLKKQLSDSDASIIRVLENLIEILIEEKVIDRNVFPKIVYDKISQRNELRKAINALERRKSDFI